jgi:hypothetical protein
LVTGRVVALGRELGTPFNNKFGACAALNQADNLTLI